MVEIKASAKPMQSLAFAVGRNLRPGPTWCYGSIIAKI